MSNVIPLQRIFRNKRDAYYQFYNSALDLKKDIKSLYFHFTQRSWKDQDELKGHLEDANALLGHTDQLVAGLKIMFCTFANVEMQKYKLFSIRKDLVTMCKNLGTVSCWSMHQLCFPNFQIKDKEKFALFNEIFMPYGYKTSLIEKLDINLKYATYELYDGSDTIVIWGEFKNDPINVNKNDPFVQRTIAEIRERIKSMFIPNHLIMDYFSYATVNDMCQYSIDKHVRRIRKFSQQVSNLESMPLTKIVPLFIGTAANKRDLLVQLCIVGGEHEVYASFLLNILTEDQSLREEIVSGLCWELQLRLAKKTAKNGTSDSPKETEKPYRERIEEMDASEHVKRKANEMLKAVEGSTGGDPKPQKYLDGLLKIPFGKYRNEPIFTDCDEYVREIKEIVKTYGEKSLPQLSYMEHVAKENASNITFSNVESFLKKMESDLSMDIDPAQYDVNDWKAYCAQMISLNDRWNNYILERRDYISQVRRTLDNAVWGHNDAKTALERIIGQWLNGKKTGSVLGLEGPPGTGKTSLAKRGLVNCFPDADGKPRPFAFLPLGGSSNGSTLEGHNYTYVGATWGRIVDMIMQAGCMDMIIFIDELDKVSRSEKGAEIIGILTHLTDSTQNTEFNDRYFDGIPIDLSRILFVFSYNDISLIDPILRDRITNIKTDALLLEDKIEISKRFLIPEILDKLGYEKSDVLIHEEHIEYIITSFTREAGVRRLKEKLFLILREFNLRKLWGAEYQLPHTITKEFIDELFEDKPMVRPTMICNQSRIGLVNGMYATTLGIGGILPIEVYRSIADSRLSIVMTGSQGDVMQQSIKCARTIAWGLITQEVKDRIQSEWKEHGVFGLHVHCPETSTPKDGPSAGGAITLAMLSLFCNTEIKNTVAMTGEIDLNGNILAIGGLQAKLAGAKRAGVTLAIIPKQNMKDLELIRKQNKSVEDEEFQVIAVETIRDAAKHIFSGNVANMITNL